MGQLPSAVTCGTRNPTVATCGPGFHTEFDLDGLGVAIEYSATQIFSPCKPPVIDTKAPSNLSNALTWNPTRRAQGTGLQGDAADPYIVSPGSLPLPPHCYGWDGSSDFNTETYYPLGTTLLQILDDGIEFGAINRVQVTVDYDVRVQRRFDQRKLVFTRVYPASFDFTTPDSDNCTNLSSSDVTTHHTDVVYEAHGAAVSTNTWNSFDLALADTQTARKQSDGSFLTAFAWHSAQWKDSSYLDPAIISDAFDRTRWGRFSFAQNPQNSFEMWAIYKFGQEIQTVTNVRFTVNYGWVQYHCVKDDTNTGDCNCNGDCPPCQGGTPSIGSGKCATMCANSGSSDSLVTGWTIKDSNGSLVASNGNLNGWNFSIVNTCALAVCVPCITQAQLLANNYQGPYTVTWGGGETCVCNGQTKYKIYSAGFTVFADVICDQVITPKPGVTVSYDVSDSRRHVRAFTTLKADGVTYDKVHVGVAPNVIPLVWQDVTTDIVAKRFSIRWDRRSLGSTLYGLAELAGDFAGQIHLYQSIDEGKTWTYKFRVDEGTRPNTRPVLLIAQDGRRICSWFQLGLAGINGVIQQKVFDAAWNVSQPTKVVLPIAEDDDFNIDEYVGANGDWQQLAFYTQSGAHLHPTGFAARDGRRFYYFNVGGQIQFYVLGGGGGSIQGTRVISNLGAVDDAQIAVDETVGADLAWYVTLVYRSGGQIVTRSSKDGIVFA